MKNKNEILSDILNRSGKSAYQLAKETGAGERTIKYWMDGKLNPNISLIKVIYATSNDDKDFLKNIKKLLENS